MSFTDISLQVLPSSQSFLMLIKLKNWPKRERSPRKLNFLFDFEVIAILLVHLFPSDLRSFYDYLMTLIDYSMIKF